MTPEFSVVVPTRCDSGHLRQSLRRLPLHAKSTIYWGMSLMPRALRRAAFGGGR